MNDELIKYEPCPLHDMLMLQWYGELFATGDIKKLLPADIYSVSKFFAYIQPPIEVTFKVADDVGMWFVAIYTPMFSGAQFDMWVKPEYRKRKIWVEAMCQALERGF